MANPMDSLKMLLTNGRANDPVKLAGLRQGQLDEMKHNRETAASMPAGRYATGATDSDISSLEGDIQADPFTGEAAQAETGKKDALRSMLFDFNRPDVAAVRNEQLGNQMKLASAPAEAAGKYSVQAAEAAGRERALVAQETQDHQDAMQRETQNGLNARSAANQAGIDNRAQITGLESGKIKAPRPPGEGTLSRFFAGWGGGPSQGDLNQSEIQRRSGGSGQPAPAGGGIVIMYAPDGRILHVPAARVAEVEAMGGHR